MSATWMVIVVSIFIAILAFASVFTAYSGPSISRRQAFMQGMILITASCIAVAGLTWVAQPFAEFLTRPEIREGVRLSSRDTAYFSRVIQLILWVLPFVTASLGTNLISDALTRNVKYEESDDEKDPMRGLRAEVFLDQRKSSAAKQAHSQIFARDGTFARLNMESGVRRAVLRAIKARRLMNRNY